MYGKYCRFIKNPWHHCQYPACQQSCCRLIGQSVSRSDDICYGKPILLEGLPNVPWLTPSWNEHNKSYCLPPMIEPHVETLIRKSLPPYRWNTANSSLYHWWKVTERTWSLNNEEECRTIVAFPSSPDGEVSGSCKWSTSQWIPIAIISQYPSFVPIHVISEASLIPFETYQDESKIMSNLWIFQHC